MKPFTHIIIVEFEVKLYFKNEYGYEEDTMIDFIVDDGRKNISKEIEKLKDKIRDSYTEILDTKVYSAYIDNVLEDYLIEHYETQDEKRKLDIEKISSTPTISRAFTRRRTG